MTDIIDLTLPRAPATCLECVIKHLSQAMIVHEEEAPMGYPSHIYRALGHLAEASRECVKDYPELAGVIRDHRLKIRTAPGHIPPYAGLMDYVDTLIALGDQEKPGIQESLKV